MKIVVWRRRGEELQGKAVTAFIKHRMKSEIHASGIWSESKKNLNNKKKISAKFARNLQRVKTATEELALKRRKKQIETIRIATKANQNIDSKSNIQKWCSRYVLQSCNILFFDINIFSLSAKRYFNVIKCARCAWFYCTLNTWWFWCVWRAVIKSFRNQIIITHGYSCGFPFRNIESAFYSPT